MSSLRQTNLSRAILTLLLCLPAAVHFFPVIYMLSIALKDRAAVFEYPPRLIPSDPAFSNFPEAFSAAPLARFLVNSLVVSSAITLLQVTCGILAAYALARMTFVGKRLVFFVVLATMMVPGEVTIVPNYLTIAGLGWLDTYAGLVAPFAASGFGIFLLYQFFKMIPMELEEAATLDGVSRFRFLWQFMVPLSLPAVVSFGVYAFVSAWNQYLWPLIITQSTDMRTVQIGIGMFRSQNETSSWGVVMAATCVLITPSILIFVATQRQFVRGITMSGLKG